MNIITHRLGKDPPPLDSDSSSDSETDSETDSEAERIAEMYPYTDSEDED